MAAEPTRVQLEPAEPPTQAAVPATAPPVPVPRPAGVRVLLIEDHPDVAKAFRIILSTKGYTVLHVSSAAAALEQNLDDIDLILSDIGLPDLDGRTLIGRLHAKRRLPAIALSGYGTEHDIHASLQAGFTAHLTKPAEMATLLAAIAHVMGAPTR